MGFRRGLPLAKDFQWPEPPANGRSLEATEYSRASAQIRMLWDAVDWSRDMCGRKSWNLLRWLNVVNSLKHSGVLCSAELRAGGYWMS